MLCKKRASPHGSPPQLPHTPKYTRIYRARHRRHLGFRKLHKFERGFGMDQYIKRIIYDYYVYVNFYVDDHK